MGVKPPDYLIWSILSTLCCCPVTGVIAIVYSSQVQSKWNEGDQQGAVQASQTTMRWLIGGIVANLLANVIQAVFIYLTTGFGIFFKLI
ncbi:MAG: CD225/dispanin family protein [Pirellulales bacterium]|nr:CD225/dispanin family protein [Pirellulales bacterium]